MSLKKSIIETIAFFDLFDFPLKAEEIQRYLFDYRKPLHIKELKGALNEMEEQIEHLHDFYVLKGRGNLVDKRKGRKFISEKYWARVQQYGQYVTKVPFVKMIAVCNNLAYDNATEESDIDLFIVIKEGRMWTSRLIITLILHFFGVRRHSNKIAGRFCLSFFVTPKKLSMKELAIEPIDPYLGYWTKTLMPIFGEKTYEEFTNQNHNWLRDDFDLKFEDDSKKHLVFNKETKWKKLWEWMLNGHFGNGIEWLMRKWMMPRSENKAKELGPNASVFVSDDILKFHNHDRRQEFFENWKKTVNDLVQEMEQETV